MKNNIEKRDYDEKENEKDTKKMFSENYRKLSEDGRKPKNVKRIISITKPARLKPRMFKDGEKLEKYNNKENKDK